MPSKILFELVFLSLFLNIISCSKTEMKQSLISSQGISEQEYQDKIKESFSLFKQKFKKYYSSNEEELRLKIFSSNMKIAEDLQAKALNLDPYSTLSFGVTQFSDLTKDEFARFYLKTFPEDETKLDPSKTKTISDFDKMYKSSTTSGNLKIDYKKPIKPPSPFDYNNNLPESFDWRDKGCISEVRDQGKCGSCWAFAAVAVIEGLFLCKNQDSNKSSQNKIDLSEQQIVSCAVEPDYISYGCNGGSSSTALEYVLKSGITIENNYPYTASDSLCNSNSIQQPMNIDTYTVWKTKNNESRMQEILMQEGNAIVYIDASGFSLYTGGIMDPKVLKCTMFTNHAINLIGFGVEIINGNKVPYWIGKNSWNTTWGEKGFFRILRGRNACGITETIITAKLR